MGRKTNYNKIVTDELWQKVNDKNKELLEEWVDYLYSVDRSEQTIKQYINDLKIFFVYLLNKCKNKFFIEMTKKDISRFQAYMLRELESSSSRIRRMKSAISSMSNYIENMLDEEEEFKDFRNIVNKIEHPVVVRVREHTILEKEDVENILNHLTEQGEYQKACVFALAAFSGSRIGELIQFKESYFKDEYIDNGLYQTPEKIRGKGFGKVGKPKIAFTLAENFKPYFDKWLKKRKELGVDIDDLFVYKKDNKWLPYSIHGLNGWKKGFSKILGVNFYFHCLRHFYVTSLVKAGYPIDFIKTIVGWSSADMVDIYTDIGVEEKIKNYLEGKEVKI